MESIDAYEHLTAQQHREEKYSLENDTRTFDEVQKSIESRLDEIERRDYAGTLNRPGWSCKVPDLKVEPSPYFNDMYTVQDGMKLFVITKAIDKDWYCNCDVHYDCEHITALEEYHNELGEEIRLDAELQHQMEVAKGIEVG